MNDNLKSKPAEGDFVEVSYGAYGLGKVTTKHVKLIIDVISDWTKRFRESEELKKLEKLLLDLERVQKQLREEIAVIVLRRVVPGRCRYCPL